MIYHPGEDVVLTYTAKRRFSREHIKNLTVNLVSVIDDNGVDILEEEIPLIWSEEEKAYVCTYRIPENVTPGPLKFYVRAEGIARDIESTTILVER